MKESRTTPSLTLPGATDILDYTFDVAGSPTVDRRNAYYATRVPGASDNSDAGFKRGSVWIFGDQVYVCVNSDPSQAQWVSAAPSPVLSVNGQTGDVELTPEDVGAATAAQGALADTALQLDNGGNLTISTGVVSAPGFVVTGDEGVDFTTEDGLINTRNNLGLGTAALEDSSAFATAAQGDLADTAIQKNTSDTTPVNAIRVMTQAEYDALGTYDPNTLYFIK